ncbi:MAG: ribbon-helix-helix protein, CopG family [Rhodothermales bacterium]
MRTTIDIDDDVMRELKKLAVSTNRTLRSVIEDAVRAELGRREQHAGTIEKTKVVTFKGRGTRPGVNLNSSADLLDLMEGRE